MFHRELKAIESPWQLGLRHDNMYWYRDIEGQKVRFYIYKPSDKYNESLMRQNSAIMRGLLLQVCTQQKAL